MDKPAVQNTGIQALRKELKEVKRDNVLFAVCKMSTTNLARTVRKLWRKSSQKG